MQHTLSWANGNSDILALFQEYKTGKIFEMNENKSLH
jgi:hypothetical protein